MAQTGTANYPIPNDTGANFRADVNENLTDLYSTSSGSSAPPGAIDNQMWVDTSTTPDTLKIKQGSTWITLLTIETNGGLSPANSPTFSGNLNLSAGSASSLPLRVVGDTDTGLFFATNTVNIHAGGTTAHEFTASYSTPKVPLRVPDGSDSAPSVTNSGDENTGLYFPFADEIGFTCGGTRRVGVSSTGLIVRDQNSVQFHDSDSSHSISMRAPGTVGANYTLTLPANNGNSNQVLKTDGSGNTSWDDVSNIQTQRIKGCIAFWGSSGSATKATNLSVSRNSTGVYTVTMDASIQDGSTNYGVVIGNVDEKRLNDATHSVTDNWQNVWLDSRSNGSFVLKAIEYHPYTHGLGGDDEDRTYTFNRDECDPEYISLIVF